ncbi:MAG: DUF975 family protein [Prevotella sp.]|nr:DUF975 family protein [Prevotella sp.]
MEKIRTYKQRAKASLKNNWGNAVAVILIYFAITIGISAIDELFANMSNYIKYPISLFTSVLLWPLCWGVYVPFLSLVRGERINIKNLWDGYRKENILRILTITFIVLLIIVAIFIGMVIVNFIVIAIFDKDLLTYGSFISVQVLIAFILVCILYLRWSMAFFIMHDDIKMKNMGVLNYSAQLMKGHKWQFFKLLLSLAWWVIASGAIFVFVSMYLHFDINVIEDIFDMNINILSFDSSTDVSYMIIKCVIIALYISFLWLIPYVNTATAHFYEDLKAEQLPQM